MGFGTLAIIAAAGLIGPLLSIRSGWNIPIVLGELIAGMILGITGFGWLDASNPTFSFMAQIGFALVMFVAGSHVPVRDPILRRGIKIGTLRALLVAVFAAGLGIGIAALFGTGNAPLYAVLMASSSAALILPIVGSLQLGGPPILELLPQIAIADAACIVALPLVSNPDRALQAAIGACAVVAAAGVLYVALGRWKATASRKKVHRLSERRKFTIELRVSLAILFGLCAIATATHVSIMLAGFAFGLVVAAIGQPRRLTKQLFALTEGFLGPLFFVWLGASLNVRDLAENPSLIMLGVALGVGAALAHITMRVTGQPLHIGAMACAQLGVPVAAATLATEANLLQPGEAPALILGALVTIAITTIAAGVAARNPASALPRQTAAAEGDPAVESG
jgi:Kef-type K+ transport system membrane component KefB